MNLEHMEILVKKSRLGNMMAREEIIESFTPFIINLSNSYNIYGYDFHDRVSEGYKSLLNCINEYDLNRCNFVAFGISSIKNNFKTLYRNINKRSHIEGDASLILTNQLEEFLTSDLNIEEEICNSEYCSFVQNCLLLLSKDDKDIIYWIFYKCGTVKDFAIENNITYYKANLQKKNALKKLKELIDFKL